MTAVTTHIAVIIAAGMGTRVSRLTDSKPLLALDGLPLIERAILGARMAEIEHFVVVSGFNGDKLRAHLDDFALREQLHVRHVVNDEYRRPNGISVLKAADAVPGTFFLLMADHVADPEILRAMNRLTPPSNGLVLGVDFRLKNPLVDLADVTKVAVEQKKIVDIGKELVVYNGFDTGIFLATPSLFTAIRESCAAGDESLSGGVRRLAKEGAAVAFDIGDRFWIDVDDEDTYFKAIRALAPDALGAVP